MSAESAIGDLGERVTELLAIYADPEASAAYLLCDRHDPEALACTVIGDDFSPQQISYGQLRERSERLAGAFAGLGIGAGDRVATLMGKSEAYLVTILALWRVGAVHVPLFTAFAPPAISFRLKASSARVIVCDQSQLSKVEDVDCGEATIIVNGASATGALTYRELMERSASPIGAVALGGDAPLIQIYTSGTTGTPKGVHVPIRALASFHVYFELGLGVQPDDVFWNAADPGWAYGLYYAVLAPLAAGMPTILYSGGFSPEATVRILEEYNVTNFAAAPTIYRSLRVAGVKLNSKLRCASSAGEPLTPEVNEWAPKALGAAVHDHYGQTETGMLINNHQHVALSEQLHPGSMGKPMPGWSPVVLEFDTEMPVQTLRRGRLALDLRSSPLAWFEGYVEEAEKTREKLIDGLWYLTGDVAHVDEDGSFYFGSRDDDVIIMAGYRIGPFDVESIIMQHEAVAECAAIASPDEVRGEVLEAVIVLRTGWEPSDRLTLEFQNLVRKGLGAHAYPRQIHYVAALPKTPSGKVQRFVLKQQRQRAFELRE